MKKINFVIVLAVLTIIFSVGVFSQLNPFVTTKIKTHFITPAITLEERAARSLRFAKTALKSMLKILGKTTWRVMTPSTLTG